MPNYDSRKRMRYARLPFAIVAISLGLGTISVRGVRAQNTHTDLTQMNLEDLMSIEVTSVSKKEQKISSAGAAIFAITQEDIRRSGATNLAGVLRMVPGVDVAQLDANIWVITIRGFSDRFADKVLVLIDGRTVYTPTSSGVYWDQQDVPLEDIERIEVIRGPDGTVWGANAVNGVISITTKKAKQTHGTLISADAGSGENEQELLQYGGDAGGATAYRVFEKYSGAGSLDLADGTPGADGWHMSHVGFRSDSDLSKQDTMTVQGDFIQTSEGETLNVVLANDLPQQPTFNSRTRVFAGNLLERWTHAFSGGSNIGLQAYYDGYDRHEEGGYEGRRTFDLDFHHHFTLSSRHDIVWGLGYRVTGDNITPKYSKSFNPAQRVDNLYGGFLQDDIAATDTLRLVVGSRIEHNGYTGFEFEPSGQVIWNPAKKHTLWASASRAIRQPARADTAIQIDVATVPLTGGEFGLVQITGNPHREAEELISYQGGYRAQVAPRFSLDAAVFWNHYHHLQTDEPGTEFFTDTPRPPHFVFPETSTDLAHARTYGAEFFANWNVTNRWRVSPGYAFLNMAFRPDSTSQDAGVAAQAGDSPKHSYELRSQLNLPSRFEWDVSDYYVGALPDQGVNSYNRLDTRIGWHWRESLEMSIVGQNLLTPRHAEFGDDAPLHTLARRTIFAKISWSFSK